MEDKGARRDAIYKIFLRNGYEEERINTMLDTYGYAQGGIAGLRSGYDEVVVQLQLLKKNMID